MRSDEQSFIGQTGYKEARLMVAAISDLGCRIKDWKVIIDPGTAKYNFFFIVNRAYGVKDQDILNRYNDLVKMAKGFVPLPKEEDTYGD